MYIYLYAHTDICIYTCTYKGERDRMRERERESERDVYISIYVHIHIYICMDIDIDIDTTGGAAAAAAAHGRSNIICHHLACQGARDPGRLLRTTSRSAAISDGGQRLFLQPGRPSRGIYPSSSVLLKLEADSKLVKTAD